MKNSVLVVPLVLLLCFVFGCQNKAEKAELEAMKAKAKLEDQNRELVTRCFEELNKGNVDFIREATAPDSVYYFPSANPKSMSPDEVIGLVKMDKEGFPDLNWSLEEQVAAGDVVISRFIVRGTHTATFQGIPATGKKIEISVIHWHRLKDGKIVEDREEADILGLMQQLGMELKPKEKE
jgi:steroid delta-isomerase-like uncharacterized protein